MDATLSTTSACTFDWQNRSLAALVDHIVSYHHAYLKHELVALNQLAQGCAVSSPQAPTVMGDVRQILAALTQELTHHMHKEELVLFPWIEKLEACCEGRIDCGGTVAAPIQVMEQEHGVAMECLSRLRWLTSDFTPDRNTSDTYQRLVTGLAALDADLRQHIHEENDILFPRALALESAALAHA